MWKELNFCYGIMSAIGIGCIIGLCWLIPNMLKSDAKTLKKVDSIELIEKAQPPKIAKDTLKILGKRI